ncbi:MAG: ThiF family adenylyltransferase [Anaeromyxobacteraceae bacterium]
MHVCDWVLQDVERELARHPPERGGALLGPPGRALVSRFVADPDAATTSASYGPSRQLGARVKELERDDGLELKGIVHSHPRGMDHPSEQDALELAVGLRLNRHMPCYLAPIVTGGPAAGDLDDHEVALGDAKISFYAAFRERSGGAVVRPVRVRVVPLERDLSRAARELGGGPVEAFVTDAGAGPMPAGRVRLDGAELLVLASDQYPELPPAILATCEGTTAQLHAPWRLDAAEEDRLALALGEVVRPPGPYRRCHGPRGGPALTRDAARARLAGWEPRLSGEEPERNAEALRDALFARSAGLLPGALRERAVLVAGCGSVGSYLAEGLARAGAGAIALLDPERVEPANLSRAAYDIPSVGATKVEALARRLLSVNPALAVAPHAVAVEALEPVALDALVRAADLVVAATDDPAAQRSLNRFAYARGKPALFVGLYAGAQGGEVLVTVPERTPCYLCATRARHAAERAGGTVARAADYGTGRLTGELALAADIQHVASAALKLALSLLVRGTGGALEGFAEEAVAAGTPYLTLSTVAHYWFYPAIFGETPGQGAYQAVWLSPVATEGCAVCGAPAGRVDPLEVPLRTPGRDDFASVRAPAGR